jgi:aryl-alcohol dehydrogenase-like predicted oxidoreductase
MSFYAYSPLAAGLLGGNPRHSFVSVMGGQPYSAGRSSNPKVLEQATAHIVAACERNGVEIRQAAFRWLFNHSGLALGDGVITGTQFCSTLHLASVAYRSPTRFPLHNVR